MSKPLPTCGSGPGGRLAFLFSEMRLALRRRRRRRTMPAANAAIAPTDDPPRSKEPTP